MKIVRSVMRCGYAPAFFLGFISAAIALIEAGTPGWVLPLLLLLAVAVSFAAEQLLPYEREWNRDHGDSVTNFLHAFVNEISIFVSVLALPLVAACVPGLNLWPHDWPIWIQLLVAILVADAGISLTHFFSHRYSWLWRLHAVHHAAPRLYAFNGLMKHPIHQAIELAAATVPLIVLGFGPTIAWLVGYAVAIQLLLQHSNVDMRIGKLGYVWAIAPAHRHHHIASAKDGDVNFGLFTTLWDHLLGTFVLNGRPTPRTGQLGIEGNPDFPRGYAEHLAAPFVRQTTP